MAEAETSDTSQIEGLFTRGEGGFRFARWGRPPVPAVFGTNRAGQLVFEEALALAGSACGLPVRSNDPELGHNFFVFLVDDWRRLKDVPSLGKLVPDLERTLSVLQGAGANQWRTYHFDPEGRIRLTVTLLLLDADLRATPLRTLALGQAVQSLLLWSEEAFRSESPVVRNEGGPALIDPWYADLLRAAYADETPPVSDNPALAAGLAAIMARIAEAR